MQFHILSALFIYALSISKPFSRRWLFYRYIFTSLINRMYIIRAYIKKENSIGIFQVGVDFDLFCLSKIFEGVFSRVSRWYTYLLCFCFRRYNAVWYCLQL